MRSSIPFHPLHRFCAPCVAMVVTSFLPGMALRAGERLAPESASQCRDLVMRQYSQITSLYVRYTLTISHDGKSSTDGGEWALSGVRRFRKRYWNPEDKAGRWGCAVYDGHSLRSYDSGTGAGTVRSASQYDPRGANQPSTWSDYSRCVGHLTHGTIWELMAAIPLPKWDVTWAEDGHSLVFATREVEPPMTDEWTLDPLRGYVITRWRCLARAEDGGSVAIVEMNTLHVREAMPGVWLPTEVETRMKRTGGKGELLNRVLVDEIRVNSPETERLFSISWPQSAMYYDYRLNASVDPSEAYPRVVTNSIGMELVLVYPGQLGVPDEGTGGTKTLTTTKPYYLGMYEVTQEQWQKVMGSNPSVFKGTDRPVEKVRWLDCVEFCRKLSALEGRTYRLPSGDEWEYACRARGTGRFCFGDDEALLGEYAWYAPNSGDGVDEKGHSVNGSTHPVGQKKPNVWGFHDMHGNVHEWCADEVDPHGDRERRAEMAKRGVPMPGSWRMMRGGCYPHPSVVCHSSSWQAYPDVDDSFVLGLRVALDPAVPQADKPKSTEPPAGHGP